MNPRTRRTLQKSLAVTLYALGVLALALAFIPVEYPDWWPRLPPLPAVEVSWWPVVVGISPFAHYSARLFLTLAFGLTIFLPQVESTFVSLMRRKSPIGAPYLDRRDFACPNCGRINRPNVQFCVGCGSPITRGTRQWDSGAQSPSGLLSLVKFELIITAIMAFILGAFDLTLLLLITDNFGVDSVTVVLATILSSVPSIAGFTALKEGIFRKYSSLKRFDRLVFGKTVWLLFGLLFIGLSFVSFFFAPRELLGTQLLFWLQLLSGILMPLHMLLRGRLPREATLAYL